MDLSKNRLEFHNLLENITGLKNIYFQPPSTLKMRYPCIRYTRDTINNKQADNSVFKQNVIYEVTVIDPNPDSMIVDAISKMVNSRHIRTYATEGLNHDVFQIYY